MAGAVFIEPILNPKQKYIFRIELGMKPKNNGNYF